MDNIVSVKLDSRYASTLGVWQYDYGQILRIQGENLPKVVEVHFSLNEVGGDSITKIGVTTDGITEVQVPDELLENGGARFKYNIYAFVYTEDGASGNTEYRVRIPVQVRPKPSDHVTPDNTDIDPFGDVVKAVNNAAERAEASEQKAKEHAASASESAVTAEKTKDDALRKVGEKKREAIEAIQELEETSVGKITIHTDGEIQRIQNQAAESKGELEQTITNADVSKKELEHSIETAGTSKTALDKSVELAGTAKTELDTSIREAGTAKTALDESTETAGTVQETLSATVKQAGALDTSLGEEIETGTQLKTDLIASGEKAVQDIQTAGSEQLGKMQAVAEEFTADREQIATNKEDIGSLQEDLSNKITKFYASNQGENHLDDSDDGKIQDMMICGNSNQNQTKGKNLLKYPYIAADDMSQGIIFTDNKDGSISVSGTATGTAYYNFYKNIDGKRLTLASGTYKLAAKGRNKCNVFANNGVNSAKNEGTFTITDGHNEIYCYIAVREGVTVDETIYPMIQLASITDESYEPYTGGIPSPSPDYPQEIKRVVNPIMKVCGKNLWDNFKTLSLGNVEQKNGTYISTADTMQVDITSSSIGARPLLLKANNAYTFSLKTTVSISSPKFVCLRYTNGESNNIIFTNKNFVNFVPERDVEKIGFILYESVAGDKAYDVQLEMGSEATSYEPYTEQSVQLPYTFNAIPVASGGNVTIDGQQYIADRVVEKDGVFGIERNIREIHTNTKTMNNSEEYPGWNKVEGVSDTVYYNENPTGDSRKLTFISNFTQASFLQNSKRTNNILYFIKNIIGYSQSELIAKAIDVDMCIRLQDAIFEPLPGDIQAKLRTLVTNYPVTNISVTSDQLDGYTVFNYPISMANGWNYVKQQLNDNRDYIYDMDIQSAEAYVNSEYAVALTELEVM
mgnify:CR=1 FL=1